MELLKLEKLLRLAYVDRANMDIDTNKTIWEQITDGQELVEVGGRQMNSRHMSRNLILVDQIRIKK